MKKMRKLIPALSMLMVAAIMLTTASFAWFTMNENVTATGMEVQAKANGSLVISNDVLTYKSNKATATLETGAKELYPLHLDADTNTWYKPLNGAAVHPTYGTPGLGGLTSTEAAENVNYYDNYIYLGTAGDKALKEQTITITLTAPTSAAGSEATKAYSVAIYVLGEVTSTNKDSAEMTISGSTVKPKIIHVDNSTDTEDTNDKASLRHIVELTEMTIPSIVGVGDQNENVTGLKLGIRVFVDGDLAKTTETTIETGYYEYVAATGTFEAGKDYFYFDPANENNEAHYTKLTPAEIAKAPNGKTPSKGWYTYDADNKEFVEVTSETAINYDGDTGLPVEAEYYVRNYAEANTSGYVVGQTSVEGKNFYTIVPVTTKVNERYVSGVAPSTGSVLALDIKTATPATENGESGEAQG